ncbi:hypothetical protein Sf25_gp120 [Shigella phage Sf25]|uniref:Uncharacterized protein n=1 Tax=Shigella phage Sf25 TaxID=2024310 RepID=A0A2K9VM46_9CAUD|nr:hypothetical protein Sf25_gp120 [Shigella phage Sf25]
MKKIIKAIWNVVIILVVLSIFPIVLMIDMLNVVGIYLMAVVGMDIHQNGLKSVVETIWNGVK